MAEWTGLESVLVVESAAQRIFLKHPFGGSFVGRFKRNGWLKKSW